MICMDAMKHVKLNKNNYIFKIVWNNFINKTIKLYCMLCILFYFFLSYGFTSLKLNSSVMIPFLKKKVTYKGSKLNGEFRNITHLC